MDYKRVLKLHFENGYSGRTIAKNTGEGQRTAINEFLKRFKECEELNWPLSEEVTNEDTVQYRPLGDQLALESHLCIALSSMLVM